MTMLPALIERLENAEEGSRDLDAKVLHASGLYPKTYMGKPVWSWGNANSFQGFLDCRTGDGDDEFHHDAFEVPHYTTSLEAALTLVPNGWSFKVFGDNIEGQMEYGASVNYVPSHASTGALALCIAALKARA